MNISLSANEIQSLRELLSQQLNYLSPSHLLELSSFLGYLKHRDNLSTAKKPSPMTLEGLWKDLPLEVTEEDIRHLRQQLTAKLEEQFHALPD